MSGITADLKIVEIL